MPCYGFAIGLPGPLASLGHRRDDGGHFQNPNSERNEMIIDQEMSNRIVAEATKFVGKPYDWRTFDCIHFIIAVYRSVGIEIPRFGSSGFPPRQFHLTKEEFEQMPIGHSVFFKRKAKVTDRVWSHAAIIFSQNELIHCSRHFGPGVTVTAKSDFLQLYDLAASGDECET